jgi:hypothetical protein
VVLSIGTADTHSLQMRVNIAAVLLYCQLE